MKYFLDAAAVVATIVHLGLWAMVSGDEGYRTLLRLIRGTGWEPLDVFQSVVLAHVLLLALAFYWRARER